MSRVDVGVMGGPPRARTKSALIHDFYARSTFLDPGREGVKKRNTRNMEVPIKIGVTGAAGQIAYSLLPHLVSGSVFGMNQPVVLSLLDIPPAQQALAGVVMELYRKLYQTTSPP